MYNNNLLEQIISFSNMTNFFMSQPVTSPIKPLLEAKMARAVEEKIIQKYIKTSHFSLFSQEVKHTPPFEQSEKDKLNEHLAKAFYENNADKRGIMPKS